MSSAHTIIAIGLLECHAQLYALSIRVPVVTERRRGGWLERWRFELLVVRLCWTGMMRI